MVAGIKALFLGLSVNITQAIYPLIPRLYNAFEYFAKFKFLEMEEIKDIWNNIYVLVGVIVLFAIAIKLISAIVNPDELTDNKKGVKGTYLRAVFTVILIFLFPFVFELSYQVQDDLLSNDFLISKVFGYKIKKGGAGQLLAWETFSAFCEPVDANTKAAIKIKPTTGQLAEYYRLEQDIDYIKDLDFELFIGNFIIDAGLTAFTADIGAAVTGSLGATGNYKIGFEYHPILCPLAGALVAYELFLLCMDTIFRSAKLAMLEIILPIVLGAYVFNAEILKKWAKEFFSTYIIVFLKVLIIGFMIIAIAKLKGVI